MILPLSAGLVHATFDKLLWSYLYTFLLTLYDPCSESSFRKLNPEHLKLLETVAAKTKPGQPVDRKALIAAMKDALGDVLDDTTMKALEVRVDPVLFIGLPLE